MIADALFSLMNRKLFQKISITEICEEAAIGRKTFYRNFDTKEDVIHFHLNGLCEQYEKEIQGLTIRELLYHHFVFLRQHSDIFVVLYHNDLHQMAARRFAELIPQTMPQWSEDPVQQEYYSAYLISGIEAIQRIWVKRGFQENTDEVVAYVQRLQAGIQLPGKQTESDRI